MRRTAIHCSIWLITYYIPMYLFSRLLSADITLSYLKHTIYNNYNFTIIIIHILFIIVNIDYYTYYITIIFLQLISFYTVLQKSSAFFKSFWPIAKTTTRLWKHNVDCRFALVLRIPLEILLTFTVLPFRITKNIFAEDTYSNVYL